jgi:hypothetical protein
VFIVKAARHCKLRKIIIAKSSKVRKNDISAASSSVLRRDEYLRYKETQCKLTESCCSSEGGGVLKVINTNFFLGQRVYDVEDEVIGIYENKK